jgi:aspartate carbamoyltransferase catalytic subunit
MDFLKEGTPMKMTHLLTIHDVMNHELDELFMQADALMKVYSGNKQGIVSCKLNRTHDDKTMATLFLEPSLRTRLSFESAMLRLGGKVVSSAGSEATSAAKGESLADMIRTVSEYADIVVVRSPKPVTEWGSVNVPVPIINAGSSHLDHPTQAMIDAFTIWRHYGSKSQSPIQDGITIGIVGDLSKSRAIRSFVQLMGRSPMNRFFLYDSTGRGEKLCGYQQMTNDFTYMESITQFEERLPELDVLYLNRIQSERWTECPRVNGAAFKPFVFRKDHLSRMKKSAIVLNPGPRREELPDSVIDLEGVKFWKQVRNGLYLRMALIHGTLHLNEAKC